MTKKKPVTKPRQYRKQGLTQARYARWRNCSPQTVYQAKKRGWLVLFSDGSIDPKPSDEKWAQACGRAPAANPMAKAIAKGSKVEPGQAQDTLQTEKIAHEKVKTLKTQLVVDQMQGRLVSRELAEQVLFAVLRAARDAALAIPARTAPELCAMADAAEIRALLMKEIREALAFPNVTYDELLKQSEGV